MIPEFGKIHSLPIHVIYNHPSLPTNNSNSSSSSSLCSLIIPTTQDVFIHRTPLPNNNNNNQNQARKRRRIVKLEDDTGCSIVGDREREGERSGSVESEQSEVEEDWYGSVALKSLIKAICYASPDLIPSLSVPDSSIYLPTSTTNTSTIHPTTSTRSLYEGKGLLSLILTEPTPGRTIVKGRLLQSSLFSNVINDLQSDDDNDDDDGGGGGGLEALVRAANKRKEREEEIGWGLEVELMLRPVGGSGGTSFAASSPMVAFGSGNGVGMGGGYDRSSPALGLGNGGGRGSGSVTGESYEPRQLTNTRQMVSSPVMARRRSRTDEVRSWDRDGRFGRSGSVPSSVGRGGSGDDDSGIGQHDLEQGLGLQLPPAYQSSLSPPPQPRPPILLNRNVRSSVGPSRRPSTAAGNIQPRSTSVRPPPSRPNSRSTPAYSPMVNNPEFQILPPRTSQPPRLASRAESQTKSGIIRPGTQRLREGSGIAMSDPVDKGKATEMANNRSASIEPQQSLAAPTADPSRTAITGSTSQFTTPKQVTSSLPPANGLNVIRASPASGNPMALARSILRNPTINTMELAQKLIGKEALIKLLSEMGVDLPTSATVPNVVTIVKPTTVTKPKTPPRGKFVPPPRNPVNENHTTQSKAQPATGPSIAPAASATADANPTVIHRCDNCGTTQTSLWRTKVTTVGIQKRVCDDCGVYFNDKKKMRPKSLWGLVGEAALGKDEPTADTGKTVVSGNRPKTRLVNANKGHDSQLSAKGPSEKSTHPPPASPLRQKRPSEVFASPRRSTRLKTGQTPKLSPIRPPSSEEFNGIEDSPSKHLRLTPRRKAQARNMEHDLNSHAKFKLGGDKQGQQQQQNSAAQTNGKHNASLGASPFASASSSTETSQPSAAHVENTDWDEQIRRLFTTEQGLPGGADLLAAINHANTSEAIGSFGEADLDIQELLNAVAADPVDSNDGQALLGANFTQAEIEMLLSTMGNTDGKTNRDLEWQPFPTSPWSVENNTPADGAGPANRGPGTSAGVTT